MAKRTLPLAEVYRHIEPGPVVLVTSAARGRVNVMPMSWHMMMEFEPPLLGCIISARNYTFDLIDASGECVVNIPTVDMVKKVVACGNASGRRMDKFRTFGLTPAASARVKPPLVEECYASLECKVADRRMVAKYNMFVLAVVKAWSDPSVKRPKTIHHAGRGVFAVVGGRIRLASGKK
jgi:flavin reductase (DIM6/NTAB) family NADH-FMN oxidoreductase RutF